MAEFRACKIVSSLPGTLVANTMYLVRVGAGFEPFFTNSSGTIVAYGLDTRAVSGGGTGATDASGARTNLGVPYASQSEVDAGTVANKVVTPEGLYLNHRRRLRIRYGASAAGFSTDLFAEQETVPTSNGFSWYNQGTSTFDAATGILQVGGTATTNVGLFASIPSGDWDYALWLTLQSNTAVASGGTGGNYTPSGGIAISDGTKLVVLGESTNSSINATYPHRYFGYFYWNTATSFSSQPSTAAIVPGAIRAYRFIKTGSNLGMYYSRDGVMWDGLTTVSYTAHIASPTLIGFVAGMTGSLACKGQVAAFRRFA